MQNSRVMVCVTQQKNCERLILNGSKYLENEEDELYVIHVVNEDQNFLNKKNDGEALEYLFGVCKGVGADMTMLRSKDIFQTLVDFALEKDISHVVMGRSQAKGENKTLPDRLEEELDFVQFKKL